MQAPTILYRSYTITTDKTKMHIDQIHKWLSEKSYWSQNIPIETVRKAFDHSFCIGVLSGEEQIGYARLVTDYATFAYLADVFVKEEHRGKGLSKKMMEALMDLDWVKQLRRIMLATLDAHELYAQYGFQPLSKPERIMEITRPGIYNDNSNPCT